MGASPTVNASYRAFIRDLRVDLSIHHGWADIIGYRLRRSPYVLSMPCPVSAVGRDCRARRPRHARRLRGQGRSLPSTDLPGTGLMDHFQYRDGRLYAEDVDLARVAAEFGTPCYVYSRTTLERHFRAFEAAFAGHEHL